MMTRRDVSHTDADNEDRLGRGPGVKPIVAVVLGLILFGGMDHATAQDWRGGRGRGGAPQWEIPDAFRHDVFTFVRVRYSSNGSRFGRRGGGGWDVDYPDADLNFAYRLQEMTSLKVHPEGKALRLTDPELFEYPFIYMVEPGALYLFDEEVKALRRYLLNGGFLMVDDFWGEAEWANFYQQIKRVFPDRSLVELPLDHPIFHCVFDLEQKPQIPSVGHARRYRGTGRTWERPDAKEVHFKAIFDDQDRMMAIICHNTDLGDGWEEEATDPWYFREFSEKKAYPMGINIVFYAMTH